MILNGDFSTISGPGMVGSSQNKFSSWLKKESTREKKPIRRKPAKRQTYGWDPNNQVPRAPWIEKKIGKNLWQRIYMSNGKYTIEGPTFTSPLQKGGKRKSRRLKGGFVPIYPDLQKLIKTKLLPQLHPLIMKKKQEEKRGGSLFMIPAGILLAGQVAKLFHNWRKENVEEVKEDIAEHKIKTAKEKERFLHHVAQVQEKERQQEEKYENLNSKLDSIITKTHNTQPVNSSHLITKMPGRGLNSTD